MRTRKNVSDDHVGEISAASTDSLTPTTSDATTAPPRLPEPAQHDDREQARDQVVVAAGVEREHDPVHRARRGGRRRR